MYSGTALTFSEGNTFSYYNMFIYTGTYELYSENIYHLQTEEVTWLSVDENGASEKPMTKADKPAYVVTVLDENTIRFNLSGASAIDDISLIFVRLDSESDYIQANKTPLTRFVRIVRKQRGPRHLRAKARLRHYGRKERPKARR